MGDLKKFIFPVIAALVVHGFFISFKLPKHDRLKPILQGNPIRIEINSFSPPTIVPQEKKESKQVENIAKAKSLPKVVPKKVIAQQPINIPKKNIKTKQKKVVIKPNKIEKEVVVEKRDERSDLHNSQQKNQNINITETVPEKLNDKAVILQKTAIPIYRNNKQPPYPVMAKRRGYEGKILLNVLVDFKGFVAEIKIKHPSGHRSLDTAAFETVKNWLFTPASEGGRPVAMWVEVPIEFQLK